MDDPSIQGHTRTIKRKHKNKAKDNTFELKSEKGDILKENNDTVPKFRMGSMLEDPAVPLSDMKTLHDR